MYFFKFHYILYNENILLTNSDVNKFYTDFCKVNLWPLFHNFNERINGARAAAEI